MDQYIQISEIKAADDRKLALDAIGTDNFNRTIQQIKKDELIKENTQKIKKDVASFAKEAPKGVDHWSRGYDRIKDVPIEKYKSGDLNIKVKKGAEYFYYFTDWGRAYILKKSSIEEPQKNKLSDKEKAARKRRRELNAITKEMYQLRRAFMMDFSAGLKHKDTLTEWMMAQIVGCAAGSLVHCSLDKKPLQEKIGQDQNRTYDIDKDLLREFYDRDPGAAMAIITYSNSGDNECNGYYYGSIGESMPRFRTNKDLDVIYDYLCRLGYQMCDEEKQLQDGTHPLFEKEK
jgi:hypothetical protein